METRRVSNRIDETKHFKETEYFVVQSVKTEIPSSDIYQLLHKIH